MNHAPFPGGWYIDARPNGSVVVLFRGSHLEHNGARVELPHGQNVLYLDLAPEGRRFVGQGHDGPVKDRAQEWTGFVWADLGPAPGVRPCIHDHDGVIRFPDATTGSQGWRYIDERGEPVPSDRTMADKARRMWEYTELPSGITIGQGGKGPHGEDPLIVLINGKRRRISRGQCRFIKARENAALVSLAWVQEVAPPNPKPHETKGAHALWLTAAELAQFPIDAEPAPAPQPVPPSRPEPVPVTFPDAVKDTIRRIFPGVAVLHKGSDDDRRQATRITIEQIVYEHPGQGWGWKASSPTNPPSKDAIARQVGTRLYSLDHINGASRELALGDTMEDITGQFFIPVEGKNHLGTVPNSGTNVPNPGTPQPPAHGELDRVVQKMLVAALAPVLKENAELRRRVDALESRPAPKPAEFPKRIALKSDHGKYVCAEGDGRIVGDREGVGAWETFTVEPQP